MSEFIFALHEGRHKSARVKARLMEIYELAMQHQANIEFLTLFRKGYLSLDSLYCTDSAIRYEQTLDDKARYWSTLNNLQQQMAILQREWETLIAYGEE